MTNKKTSLSIVIEENSSLLSVIGVFAAIATYFQSKIDTSVPFEFSSQNRAYIMVSFFSYAIVILLSNEFRKNVVLMKNKSASVKTFFLIFLAFLSSLVFVVLDVHETFISANSYMIVKFIVVVIGSSLYIFLFRKLIESSKKYNNLPSLKKSTIYYVGLFLFAYLSLELSNFIANMIVKILL